MIHRSLMSLLILVILSGSGRAQDPVFSHFYSNGIHLNPAWAGVEGPTKVFLGYRNQWPSTGSSYVTYQASYDQYIEKLHGGIGVRVLNDRQGDGAFNTFDFAAMYTYQFQVSRWLHVSGGIQAGMGQQAFNYDPQKFIFGNMIDPVSGGTLSAYQPEEINSYSEFYPDFATGVTAFYKGIYGGLAVHHLLKPVITDKNDPSGFIPRRFTAHIGAIIPIMDKSIGRELLELSPNLVFIQQQNIQQINYGLEVIYRGVMGGVWLRHDMVFNYGDIIFSAGYSTSRVRFRYSYDVTMSSPAIRLPNMGAHEFSLLIIYDNLNKRKKHSAIKCPKF